MALTLDKWIAAAIAGCLIAVVLVSSDGDSDTRRRQPVSRRYVLEERSNRAASAASRASDRLRRKLILDSVNAATVRTPRSNTIRLFVPENLPRRAQLTKAINARLGGSLPAKFATSVDFVVPADTGRAWRRDWNLHQLPSASSANCVAIAGKVSTQDRDIRDWIGPCGFYAAFGAPGVNIDRWLRSGAWIYGSTYRNAVTPVQDLSDYFYWYDRNMLWRESSGFPMRRLMGTLAYACLAGTRSACGPPMLNPRDNDQGHDWSGSRPMKFQTQIEGSVVWARSGDWAYFGWLMGPAMKSILSDMAVSLGPDRFRQFWTSPLPPAEAFRAATGESIEDWTAGWMRRTYGEFGLGPRVSAMAVVYALGIALLALGGASVTWRRRQVL